MSEVLVKIKPENPDSFVMPKQATTLAAGFDCYYQGKSNICILPGDYELIPLGFSMEIPPGYEAQIRPRSGLAKKHGLTVLNSPGTIDADYRGPVGVILISHKTEESLLDEDPYVIGPGDRICQIVVSPVPEIRLELVNDINETDRGVGGFGSTGK
jgi:dUTP pyrophosphatase